MEGGGGGKRKGKEELGRLWREGGRREGGKVEVGGGRRGKEEEGEGKGCTEKV